MDAKTLERVVRSMCSEVYLQSNKRIDWRRMSESELLYEAAVCVIGSQMVFEHAVAIAQVLKKKGLLVTQGTNTINSRLEASISDALSQPCEVLHANGQRLTVRPRFKNRIARLLASTIHEIYGTGYTLRGILLSSDSAQDARKELIKYVWGFGPKQASLFLRRIGFCHDLAVLDVHVLNYLALVRGSDFQASKLGQISFYERVESDFRDIAYKLGHSLGCVDLAIWVTMRVAKREALLWDS